MIALRVGPGNATPATWQGNARLESLQLAPRLLHDEVSVLHRRHFRCTIWEWQSGRPLDPKRDWRRMADALSTLHRRTRGLRIAPVTRIDLRKFLHKEIKENFKRINSGGAIGRLLQRIASEQLSMCEPHDRWPTSFQCLVHNDLVRKNILVESGHVWLVDWEGAMNASPVLDLCGFLSPFVRSWEDEVIPSQRSVAIFLHRYLASFGRAEARAILSELAQAWDTYNAMLALWVWRFAGREQSHLHTREFYQRAFAGSGEFPRWIKSQLAA